MTIPLAKHADHDQSSHGNWARGRALNLATLAHEGQTDKAGAPYINHPIRVAERLADASVDVYVAALLHDTVEDTWLDLDTVSREFGAEVARLVDAVTKREGESKADYYARIKAAGPDAVLVKKADIADNTDPDRLAALPEETANKLRVKYAQALTALS